MAGAPLVPRRGSSPAPLDAGLGVPGWMLLGMQVAPATVAMENTWWQNFQCPSLSVGEALGSGETGTAGSAPGGCRRAAGTVCARPGSSWLFPLGSGTGRCQRTPEGGFGGARGVCTALGEQVVLHYAVIIG